MEKEKALRVFCPVNLALAEKYFERYKNARDLGYGNLDIFLLGLTEIGKTNSRKSS